MNDNDVIITTLPKNATEEVRVFLTTFQNHHLCGLRVFYEPKTGGERLPGKSGLNVRLSMLPAIITGLQQAYEEARRRGLVDDGGAQ